MGKIVPRTLPGFMELLPNEQIRFNYFLDKIKKSYESFGFLPLDTPTIEHAEVLLAKTGGETEKQVYEFTKGDSHLVLRYDLTVPLAKYVSLYKSNLSFPFKRYQIGKVFRGERAQKGRFREFYQCDIDIIGENTLDIFYDAEVLSAINSTFNNIGFTDFIIKINNRKILKGIFEFLNINEKSTEILRIIDKKDKIGQEKIVEELSSIGILDDNINKLIDFMSFSGSNDEKIDLLNKMNISNKMFEEGVHELEKVINYIRMSEVPEESFIIDQTIARGLDYYTGTVYETFLNQHKEIGSICSGGRYDDLAECYTDAKLPGVGISIGLTRLFSQVNKLSTFDNLRQTTVDVVVIPLVEAKKACLSLTTFLRKNGINTDIMPFDSKKLKNKFKYVSKTKVKLALIIGEEELKTNKYTIKNLETGEQQSLSSEELVRSIKNCS
ncbi:MAG: histidine--tRNA ligase [Candidatus Improbicoccus pseudotrichonymphae]|uniref:Histidine--tRNA ligase n=1 Tax=Candidatus Improbicoccus pseudotrichonymphae TaxID=3033792 RepID=A0AA48KYQ4_9FIRM|nr:MAG: histidine--tRNA ligase [Candidatus Improbicoccus pseudotrichonymphae]